MPVSRFFIFLAFATTLAADQAFLHEVTESNVNQRYLIESVSLKGVELDQMDSSKMPARLRDRLKALIGQKCDMAALQDLAAEIRRELHFRTVNEHLLRGSEPDRIRVDFDAAGRDLSFDVSVPKLLYTSHEQATGEVDANIGFENNKLTVGVVSNSDDLLERFTGVTARFESAGLGTDRVRSAVTFEDYHETWNPATQLAADGSGIDLYRARWNVAPQIIFSAGPLTISPGISFEQMQPESPAAPSESANAATLDVRYGRKIEGDVVQHRLEGKYSLRVAARALGSTYSYARHMISFRYEAHSGRQVAADEFIAGAIAGNAPLFERFVLGNTSTLQGWNRFQIDPLGGNRVVNNEVSYGYRVGPGTVEGFYDSGALWQAGGPVVVRHSVGVGYKQGMFVVATAFPVREGRIEPVFIAGQSYKDGILVIGITLRIP